MASAELRGHKSELVPDSYLLEYAAKIAALGGAAHEQSVAEIQRLLGQALQARVVVLMLPEDGGRQLRGRAPGLGLSPAAIHDLCLSLEEGSLAAGLLRAGQPSAIETPRQVAALPPMLGPGRVLAVPLTAGQVGGLLLVVGRPQRVSDPAARELAKVAAAVIGSALAMTEQLQLVDELRHANRGWRELLAQLSHELRAALTPILTWTQILARQARLERRWQKAIGVIERNTREQVRLVDDLLGIAGYPPAAGRPHRVDVGEQLQAAADAVRAQAQARQVELRVERPADGTAIEAEPRQLQQVIANLLRNAVRNAPQGGFIALSTTTENDAVVLKVSNPQGGFESASFKRTVELVEESQTAHKASTSAAGLGVGVALIRPMIERQGGELRAGSAGPGTGVSFEVRLPGSAGAGHSTAARGRDLDGVRVLLIEDHQDSREAVAALLEAQGAQVATAACGEEGIQRAHSERPDVVVCDLAMPGMNGYDVARHLRADAQGRPLTLLALSAHGAPADVERARQAGFSAHLLKPVEALSLVKVIAASAHA
ncbi:MAG TPA: response regulator [Candidatus Binataceae bacterium]|nr:response regulator [Candidatus Binataceae bacterium]